MIYQLIIAFLRDGATLVIDDRWRLKTVASKSASLSFCTSFVPTDEISTTITQLRLLSLAASPILFNDKSGRYWHYALWMMPLTALVSCDRSLLRVLSQFGNVTLPLEPLRTTAYRYVVSIVMESLAPFG